MEVTELATAPALLRAMNPGVVLLAPGLDVRAQLLEAVGGETPARLVAVVRDPGDAMVALASGAHDALPLSAGDEELGLRIGAWARAAERERHHSGALAAVASRILELETRLQEVEHERDRLRELAHRDELTSLGNRRSFRSQVDYALTWADRYGGMVTVVVADLDGMKQLNDTCGHAAGDAALRLVAQVIRGSLRGVDHAARLGGDEFGIVTPRTSAVDAARVAERIRRGIEDLPLPGRLRLSASFGVASRTLPKGVGFAAEELIARADQALYAAKRAGKNRVVIDEASAQAAA